MSDFNNRKRGEAVRAAARAGLSSARANALPGFILWIAAMAIVAGYYFLSPVRDALDALGRIKASGGFLYSAISTGIFGGLIPSLWLRVLTVRRLRRDGGEGLSDSGSMPWWMPCLFLSLFWAYKGVELDFFYKCQSLVFGTGFSASVLVPKVLVDQLAYNPLWASWTQILAYWWLENRFKPSALVDRALWGTMLPRILIILISTWAVWFPMVSIIYSMPPNLQIPLFNIVLCFWSLMLASLTKEKK
jgi:hypothetical protein